CAHVLPDLLRGDEHRCVRDRRRTGARARPSGDTRGHGWNGLGTTGHGRGDDALHVRLHRAAAGRALHREVLRLLGRGRSRLGVARRRRGNRDRRLHLLLPRRRPRDVLPTRDQGRTSRRIAAARAGARHLGAPRRRGDDRDLRRCTAPSRHRDGRGLLLAVPALMPRHVVVLGGGVSGEAFIAALRRLDEEIGVTLVEDELVGGECSYWACIPSKTLLRPVEIAFRAKHAHGVDVTIDPEQIFWWRDQTAGKDDSSQVKWVEELGAEVVRGKGVVTEPGRIEVDGRELSYDELMVSTGSLPQ